LADLCGALHCDLMMEFKKPKSKCNAAAAVRNRHLCEVLIISCNCYIFFLVLWYSGSMHDTYPDYDNFTMHFLACMLFCTLVLTPSIPK
jgi:hypothetical protein